jgi:hypothetical protein
MVKGKLLPIETVRFYFVATVQHPSLDGGRAMLASRPDADLVEARPGSIYWQAAAALLGSCLLVITPQPSRVVVMYWHQVWMSIRHDVVSMCEVAKLSFAINSTVAE